MLDSDYSPTPHCCSFFLYFFLGVCQMYPAMPWASTIDGVILNDVPMNLIKSGAINPVKSVMAGTNHDEGQS
jgi:hypothetical protein